MRIQILSDLHIDSYVKRGLDTGNIPLTEADIILVAGDTCNSEDGMPWLQSEAKRLDKPIFTISGNHEYFGEDVLSFDSKLATWDNYQEWNNCQEWNNYQDHTAHAGQTGARSQNDTVSNAHKPFGSGLKFLQCGSVDFGEIRLLGCTLWTDFEYEATPETIPAVMAFMRDYRNIRAGFQMFSPDIAMQIHYKHRTWLKQALIEAHEQGKKAVVMTHHSVSPKSVSEQYATLPSNAAFVSDLSAWMHAEWAPKLWIHGHTHEAFDYQLGHTRVIVNPRAYPSEVSSTKLQFDWAKVVEI